MAERRRATVDLGAFFNVGGTPQSNPNFDPDLTGPGLPQNNGVSNVPYVQPSYWQRLTNPRYAQQVDELNTQYQNAPVEAQQRFSIARGQAKDVARTAMAYITGKTPSEEDVNGAAAAYGNKIVGGGLSPGEYSEGEQKRYEVQQHLPSKRALTAGVEAENQYQSAKSTQEQGVPVKAAGAQAKALDAQTEEAINRVTYATNVDRVNVQRAAMDAQRALGRAPQENDILDQMASNRLYLAKNVEPVRNLTAEQQADAEYTSMPNRAKTMGINTQRELLEAEHPGMFNPAAPYMYNYAPEGSQANPMYPFGQRTRNPTYSPPMMNNMMGAQMMQQQMGQGQGGAAIGQLPNGHVVLPGNFAPAAPAVGTQQGVSPLQQPLQQPQPTRPATATPTFNSARPLSFSNQPATDADMQKAFQKSQAIQKIRSGVKLSQDEFSAFTPDEYHNILQQALTPQQ